MLHTQKKSVSTPFNFNGKRFADKPGGGGSSAAIPRSQVHTMRAEKTAEKEHFLIQGVLCAPSKGGNTRLFCGHGKQADGCINKACWNIWSLLCVQLFNVFKEQL